MRPILRWLGAPVVSFTLALIGWHICAPDDVGFEDNAIVTTNRSLKLGRVLRRTISVPEKLANPLATFFVIFL